MLRSSCRRDSDGGRGSPPVRPRPESHPGGKGDTIRRDRVIRARHHRISPRAGHPFRACGLAGKTEGVGPIHRAAGSRGVL